MKLTSLFFTRQNVIGLVLVVFALWLMFVNTKRAGTAAQSSKRTIENKVPPQVPLEIVIKKEKLERIKEASNKTWYRDLEIQIKNTSKKPIYYFTLFAELPGVTDNGATIVFDITFGRKEFTEFSLKPLPDDKPLMHGETFTYSIPEESQIAWEAWQKRTGEREVEKLEIQFNHLSFGDGTGFTSRGAVPYPVKR
jgi:hypothetical protein